MFFLAWLQFVHRDLCFAGRICRKGWFTTTRLIKLEELKPCEWKPRKKTTTTTGIPGTFYLAKKDTNMADDYSGSDRNMRKIYVLLVGFVAVLVAGWNMTLVETPSLSVNIILETNIFHKISHFHQIQCILLIVPGIRISPIFLLFCAPQPAYILHQIMEQNY